VGREVNQRLGRIFAQRHKDGRTDLEAIATAVRSTVHQAGAAAFTALLQFPAPAVDPRTRPCSCGQAAHIAQSQLFCRAPLRGSAWIEAVARPSAGSGAGTDSWPVP
jgi:hypothetical protein